MKERKKETEKLTKKEKKIKIILRYLRNKQMNIRISFEFKFILNPIRLPD